MTQTSLTHRVMGGREAWTLPIRAKLRVCSALYGLAVAWRNRRFDRGLGVVSVEVPVVSVGNITTGGTGKTPLVIEIARRLVDAGRKVCVLSRGYGAARGQLPDELLLVCRRLPGVGCVPDPDRVAAASLVIEEDQIEAIVLDDAFQHRRLARDLDVVTIDATCPFGFEYLLPRGLLREPPESLRRADLIVITRADQVDADVLPGLHRRIESLAPGVARIGCRHRPVELAALHGNPPRVGALTGTKIACFSGVGNPLAFEQTVRELGGDVLCHLTFGDHHRYVVDDLARVAALARKVGAELVLTTEKDAVKLPPVDLDWPGSVAYLTVDIEFLDDGGAVLQDMLDRTLAAYRADEP